LGEHRYKIVVLFFFKFTFSLLNKTNSDDNKLLILLRKCPMLNQAPTPLRCIGGVEV